MAIKFLCDFCDKELTQEDLKGTWMDDSEDLVDEFPLNLVNTTVRVSTEGPKEQSFSKDLLLCPDCKDDMNFRVRMLKEFIESKMYRTEEEK